MAVVGFALVLLGSAPAVAAPVPAPQSLSDAEREIAGRLKADQRASGFWSTAFTQDPEFRSPSFERDTFVTPVIVDLLEPLGIAQGLDRSVVQAQAYIASQLEPEGLVRYYGRRAEADNPNWGGVIVPDADDTALAWSSGARLPLELRAGVLATLKQFRGPQGLYLTWLGTGDRLVGVDVGSNPNPPDIDIQMDVLVFLAWVDPKGARELQHALNEATEDEALWVYCARTPLLPIIRAAELQQAGYPVRLPARHQRAFYAHQDDWVEAGVLFGRTLGGDNSPALRSEVGRVLGRLWNGDIGALQAHPPLLYHNDLTAHVSRFYWSDDLGYALWLRLYMWLTNPALRASGAR